MCKVEDKLLRPEIYMLTVSSSRVRNSAKCVGTNPGATQFTRVSGASSDARAYGSNENIMIIRIRGSVEESS